MNNDPKTAELCRKGPNYWGILSILTLTIGDSIGPTGEQSPVVTMLKCLGLHRQYGTLSFKGWD